MMSLKARRSLRQFGHHLSVARRKRRLTISMMCERIGVSKATYTKMENGEPSVAMGAYAQALFVLGFGTPFGDLIEPGVDEVGLSLESDNLPKRIVPSRG